MTNHESIPAPEPVFDPATHWAQPSDAVRRHAQAQPGRVALIDAGGQISYRALDQTIDRAAASLQRDGLAPNDVVAICGANSIDYVVIMLATLRAGATFTPLAPSCTTEALGRMLDNCGAGFLFVDELGRNAVDAANDRPGVTGMSMNADDTFAPLSEWLCPEGVAPEPVANDPDAVFNIIYSSGTTGAPKGIVHTHGMRWHQGAASVQAIYNSDCVTLISTPLYSNTTLVCFLPALIAGGTLVLMPKFDAGAFLALAEQYRATHAMLVPVQYQRLLDHPAFDSTDLSSFQMKFSTSAPFTPAIKAEVLRRWPGGLTEFYGMTEGGGSCVLAAHEHPDKLHTVGQPRAGHDIRIIDAQGRQLDPRETGEIVGRSAVMMRGYYGDPERSREAEWRDPDSGLRFIRTGDIGHFDDDGFVTIVDRVKDTIISGGFNLFPSDLETVLRQHDAVLDAAVFGVPSERWGETPVAFVIARKGATAEDIKTWANERVGKFQRLADVRLVQSIPRNAIGKVSRHDLRQIYSSG